MNALREAWAIRDAIAKGQDVKKLRELLRRLPAALRRMGLVRTLEWFEVGEKADVGRALLQQMAPVLRLPMTIAAAVDHLETCDRHDLFLHHRLAVGLFDALALTDRVVEAT